MLGLNSPVVRRREGAKLLGEGDEARLGRLESCGVVRTSALALLEKVFPLSLVVETQLARR